MAMEAKNTQRVYSAPSLPPPGAVESSLAQLHRGETSWGETNSSLHGRDTYARQRAMCCPQERGEGMVQKQVL